MAEGLTPRQREVLEVVRASVDGRGRFPSIREIAARLRLRSPATIHQHLRALEERGHLRREGRRWCLPVHARKGRGVPILGRVAAGAPLLAAEHREGTIDPELLTAARGRFAVRVLGESMQEMGILPGDLVIVDPAQPTRSGDLVVAYLGADQEVVVKRLQRRGRRVALHSAHPRYAPIRIAAGDPYFRVGGRVVALLRRW